MDITLTNPLLRVRVYANVSGLSKALSKAGMAGAEKRSLAPFIANFNRAYPLTDFVDAGEYKENADFKLRGLLRLYAENAQCKHLFFAACHDGGYVADLSQYRGQTDRFTLIKTPGLHFHEEFNKLGLAVEELHGVFRPSGSAMDGPYPKPPQALQAYNSNAYNLNTKVAPTAAAPSPLAAKQSPAGDICRFYKAGKCRYGASCNNMHPDASTGNTPVAAASKMTRDSWRSDPGLEHNGPVSRTQRAFLPAIDPSQLPKKADIPEGHVAINMNGHRLDAYIEPVSSDAEKRLQRRTTTQRLCNSMHLLGSCYNPKCEYDHGELEADLKSALEWLARSVLCPKRGTCRNPRCTHGHICQKVDCARRGGRNYCKLFDKGDDTLHITDLAVQAIIPGAIKGPNNGGYSGYNDGRLESSSPTNSLPLSSRNQSHWTTGSSSGKDTPPGAERPRALHEIPVMPYTDQNGVNADEGELEDDKANGAAAYDQGAAISGTLYPVRQQISP